MASGTIVVQGLSELQRGFKRVVSEVGPMVTAELQDAGDLVARAATEKGAAFYAPGAPAKTRVTVARVYVQTTARSKHTRPNFGRELMEDAYLPALEENTAEIEQRMELMLDRLIR
jgi:hypothetical protein